MAPLMGLVVRLPSKVLWMVTRYTLVSSTNQMICVQEQAGAQVGQCTPKGSCGRSCSTHCTLVPSTDTVSSVRARQMHRSKKGKEELHSSAGPQGISMVLDLDQKISHKRDVVRVLGASGVKRFHIADQADGRGGLPSGSAVSACSSMPHCFLPKHLSVVIHSVVPQPSTCCR
eukprot:1141629-Pelagomonas_calceolata.AAC.6